MNKSSFLEDLSDSPSNKTTTRNDQIESLFDFNDEVDTSNKEPEQYEPTGLLNTIKNINLEPEKQRHTWTTIKVRPPDLAQQIGMEKLEGVKRRQKPSIGSHVSPKARVGIMLQKTPKTMQKRPKQMTAQTPKARPLDRKSAETPTSKISFMQTSLRTWCHKNKSCKKLEKNQEEKVTKFKARPLNKKILQSKGELGLFSSEKRLTTIPREFRFATNERIPPLRTANNAEFYDKIASCLESPKKLLLLRNTIPRPFHFQTDKRGAGKESKFVVEIIHKQLKEERTRIPKSNQYSCTTDHPVVRLKPESRHHTKHPFRSDTLVRREKEIQRDMEERKQLEDEEANLRILNEDPSPVPERIRRPLTSVQIYNLHVEQRAIDRTEFDKKTMEKNTAKMVDEENSSKPDTRHVPRSKQSFLSHKNRSSKGDTHSMSQRSDVLTRKDRQSKILVTTATSSAASRMR